MKWFTSSKQITEMIIVDYNMNVHRWDIWIEKNYKKLKLNIVMLFL